MLVLTKNELDTFVEPDPGGVITLRARLANGTWLPRWLKFRPATGVFCGVPPDDQSEMEIEVVASDCEEPEANTRVFI